MVLGYKYIIADIDIGLCMHHLEEVVRPSLQNA